MGWRDNLYLEGKGSFGGVEFFVDSADSTVGRRTVTHQFPGKDVPVVEDLGRAARRFTLNAYVLGENYFSQRDALRREFEFPGSAPLIHPYWGAFNAAVEGPVRIRETTAEGGMARLTVTLIQVDEQIRTYTAESDSVKEVEDAADEALTQVSEEFVGVEIGDATRANQFRRGDIPDTDAWTTLDVIEDVREQAEDIVEDAADAIEDFNTYVSAAINATDDVANEIDDFSGDIEDLILTPQTLASQLQTLGASVMAKVNRYEGIWNSYGTQSEQFIAAAATPQAYPASVTPDTGSRRIEMVKKLIEDVDDFGDDFEAEPGTTPMQLIVNGNQNALIRLFKASMLIELVRAVLSMDFASFNDATELRDLLVLRLDALADDSGDLTYRALTDLRVAMARHLTKAAEELPRIISYTPPTEVPAIVLAQQLYTDPDYEADIIARNNIRNPLLVSGGVELEVLSNE